MATGRTLKKFIRPYVDGYALGGYVNNVGDLMYSHDPKDTVVLIDEVVGALPGQPMVSISSLDGVLDNTADGMHDAFNENDGAIRDVMLAFGIRAVPASGDPTFCAQVLQNNYQGNVSDGILTASMNFGGWDRRADSLAYGRPWGNLLHAESAETAANSANASDHDYGAQTTAGGYMMYQVLSSDGTVAIKVEDADTETDISYSEILTSGDVDASTAPKSGIVALGVTATVERYTRWQIALNTATTVTFALCFVRG